MRPTKRTAPGLHDRSGLAGCACALGAYGHRAWRRFAFGRAVATRLVVFGFLLTLSPAGPIGVASAQGAGDGQASAPANVNPHQAPADSAVQEGSRLLALGPGDSVAIQVYEQPDLAATVYVGDDGAIPVGLVGAVQVGGLSPSEAAHKVERALRDGKFLVDPHVSITVIQSRSERVTVLGAVNKPGQFAIDSGTSVFDLLAEAGGTTENSADVIFVVHRDGAGNVTRVPVSLKSLGSGSEPVPVRAGDSVYVPRAEQFSVLGEVKAPNTYRLEPGMTVMEAIARAGGITDRGTTRRIQIVRRSPQDKNQFITLKAKMTDTVQADDVIKVRQSLF